MKAIIIGGFLASGKTTFINNLLKIVGNGDSSRRIALLINEFGEIPVDGALVNRGSYTVQELAGGCICCSLKGLLAEAVNDIRKKHDPELMIIEATGLAVPSEIAENVGTACGCSVYTLLCVDPEQYQKLAGRLAIYDRQLKDAGLVLLTKGDSRSPHLSDAVRTELNISGNGRRIFSRISDAVDYFDICLSDGCTLSPDPAFDYSANAPFSEDEHSDPHDLIQGICEHVHKFTAPVTEQKLRLGLAQITAAAGEAVFRIKGIVETTAGWRAVQFLEGHLEMKGVDEPDDRDSFIVFIGRCGVLEYLPFAPFE